MNTFIAMITMLVDHIGLIFFPEEKIFRVIGRIAFPLYSWFLVQGYLHTRSHKKYMLRLLVLACISQIPFTLALQRLDLNVIFTLLLSLIGLYTFDRISSEGTKLLAFSTIVGSSLFIPMDYGLYGVLLIFIFRYFEQWKLIGCHILLNLFFFLINGPGYWIQLFSILGTILIVHPLKYRFPFIPKWIYRTFYPAHLAISYGLMNGLGMESGLILP